MTAARSRTTTRGGWSCPGPGSAWRTRSGPGTAARGPRVVTSRVITRGATFTPLHPVPRRTASPVWGPAAARLGLLPRALHDPPRPRATHRHGNPHAPLQGRGRRPLVAVGGDRPAGVASEPLPLSRRRCALTQVRWSHPSTPCPTHAADPSHAAPIARCQWHRATRRADHSRRTNARSSGGPGEGRRLSRPPASSPAHRRTRRRWRRADG